MMTIIFKTYILNFAFVLCVVQVINCNKIDINSVSRVSKHGNIKSYTLREENDNKSPNHSNLAQTYASLIEK